MTWGEFKKKMQQQGVTDDTPIDFIDWSQVHGRDIDVSYSAAGEAAVTNYGS